MCCVAPDSSGQIFDGSFIDDTHNGPSWTTVRLVGGGDWQGSSSSSLGCGDYGGFRWRSLRTGDDPKLEVSNLGCFRNVLHSL